MDASRSCWKPHTCEMPLLYLIWSHDSQKHMVLYSLDQEYPSEDLKVVNSSANSFSTAWRVSAIQCAAGPPGSVF